MPIRKEKKIKVVPTTTGRREGGDNHLFYSYDDSSARFVFEFKNPDDTALDLLNATPQALLILHEESGDKKVVMEELGTISVIDGLVSFVIPDNVLGFRGKCDLYIALAFADGSSSDEVHVAFTIEESPFNKTYEEAADYYIKSFDVLLKEVELAKTNAINEINEQLPQVQSRLENVENGLRVAEGELEELLDGMNLQTMYSNSIDFGDYDYSGNPNLLSKLSYDLVVNQNASVATVSQGENSFKYNKTSTKASGGVDLYYKAGGRANWLPSNKRLVMTVKLRAGVDYSPADGKNIAIRCMYVDNGTDKPLLDLRVNSASLTQEWQEFSVTGTTPTFSPQVSPPWMRFYAQAGILGEIEMSYDIKIEEGSTATPYQPNLLDAPYYLSKAPLGENIADPTKTFPIKSSGSVLYQGNMTEPFVAGETYTITVKGTKPSTQLFGVFNPGISGYGNLSPVEGLTDVWSLTFTPNEVSTDPKILQIVQTPNASVGACQIDWLKIEKGDTRTPNIEQYKYRGIGMRDSNNLKDYVWDLAPEYVEDNLATDVKISEITGKANNYTDNSIAAVNTNVANIADDLAKQINTNKSAAESYADTKKTEAVNESKKYTDEAITNITPNRTSLRIESGFSDGFTGWVTFERIGDIVIVSYALSPKENSGTWKTPLPIASIPEEFRFNSNAYSTGSIATSNISNDVCQVGMNGQGLQFASWNRTAGIAQFAGQVTGAVKSREK
ncbi:BppU family phage baseplate upper protein [Enterococcus lactis]|uniref:BppU family phage baseplate upper protein n=1 Tax=Enterococcus lactis TaxID=357441 RepID=UPI0022E14FC9|nr:BppU family phage baseplate upper protein [Enterococcus lactis]